ncbi:hypothetical protein ACHAWF_012137 [Thalassiosira exigua]
MAAAATLAVDDENDLTRRRPSSGDDERDELLDRMSKASLHGGDERDELARRLGEASLRADSQETDATEEEDLPPTPEGLFFDHATPETSPNDVGDLPGRATGGGAAGKGLGKGEGKSGRVGEGRRRRPPRPEPQTGLPAWATPPRHPPRDAAAGRSRDAVDLPPRSCPRPTARNRPVYGSSSSGALVPPETMMDGSLHPSLHPPRPVLRPPLNSGGNTAGDGDDDNDDNCPATRAAAAMRALEATNEHLALLAAAEDELQGEKGHERHPSLADTVRTRHRSRESGMEALQGIEELKAEAPGRTFDAYPDGHPDPYRSRPNEPFPSPTTEDDIYAFTDTPVGNLLTRIAIKFVPPSKRSSHGGSALAGFLALLLVTCANYMLGPMRDAAALAVGVSHIPALTLASTVLALGSSVPVGWLFEAPDPRRRRVWRRMGLTRGETQGTSLALFYRVFAMLLLSYALGFGLVDRFGGRRGEEVDAGDEGGEEEASARALASAFFLRLAAGAGVPVEKMMRSFEGIAGVRRAASAAIYLLDLHAGESLPALFLRAFRRIMERFGKVIYVMFFLVVHLMKLHSLSLVWGVTTEAMEYEEGAEARRRQRKRESAGSLAGHGTDEGEGEDEGGGGNKAAPSKSSLRLRRLGFVGFGGTLGGILGSVIASFAAHVLQLSGLLIVAAILLELSANLSIELGRIMQRHWEEQMKYQSSGDLASLASGENLAGNHAVDSSMRKSASLGSMKRVASGSLSSGNLARLASAPQQQPTGGKTEGDGGGGMMRARSMGGMSMLDEDKAGSDRRAAGDADPQGRQPQPPPVDDNSFKQRLLRGITTILRSRLLMAIFTYNALYASTSVLLSFQRAELVANRSSGGSGSGGSSATSNIAFLAKINTASSVAVFALQASGLGARVASGCGQRGALALMPLIRLCGVVLLGWWHMATRGRPPDLMMFLVIDEFTKVINFAVAKPVRENLWRGLSAEARYEAKPIVDTLANRWGGGSAAFLVSFLDWIADRAGLGVVTEDGDRSIFGFPPVLVLCLVISAWWAMVSADVGNIRRKIDLELKKQQ